MLRVFEAGPNTWSPRKETPRNYKSNCQLWKGIRRCLSRKWTEYLEQTWVEAERKIGALTVRNRKPLLSLYLHTTEFGVKDECCACYVMNITSNSVNMETSSILTERMGPWVLWMTDISLRVSQRVPLLGEEEQLCYWVWSSQTCCHTWAPHLWKQNKACCWSILDTLLGVLKNYIICVFKTTCNYVLEKLYMCVC